MPHARVPEPGSLNLETLLTEARFIPALRATDRGEAIAEIVEYAGLIGEVEEPVELQLLLVARELLGLTALERGVAIPHVRSVTIPNLQLFLGRSTAGIPWGPDGPMVYLVFLVLAPDVEAWREPYRRLLGEVDGLVKDPDRCKRLVTSADFAAVQVVLAGLR